MSLSNNITDRSLCCRDPGGHQSHQEQEREDRRGGGCGSSYKNRPYFWSSSGQKNGTSPGWCWGFHFPPHSYLTLLSLLPNAKVRVGEQEEEEGGRVGSGESCPLWSHERGESTGPIMADSYHIYANIYNKKTTWRKWAESFWHVKPGKAHVWLITLRVSISLGVPEGPVGEERSTCWPGAPKGRGMGLTLAITPAVRWLLSGNNLNSAWMLSL